MSTTIHIFKLGRDLVAAATADDAARWYAATGHTLTGDVVPLTEAELDAPFLNSGMSYRAALAAMLAVEGSQFAPPFYFARDERE